MGAQPGVPVASESYGYDAMNRLTSIADAGQVQRSFTYNPTGDRLSDTRAGQSPVNYGYTAQTHHLTSVGAATRSVDAAGYTTSRNGTALLYNDVGRLKDVQGTLNFTYNALGQRVIVAHDYWFGAIGPGVPTGRAFFTYLEDGRLAAEYREVWDRLSVFCPEYLGSQCTGGYHYFKTLELVHQYVWAGATLVAVSTEVGQQAQWNDVYTDHLGTPRAIVGPDGNVVWRWPGTGNAFGEAPAQVDIDGNGVAFDFSLRFPGQYQDAETGLNYNHFRDYDSATGRYLESDPLGLYSGANTYGYVYGNPLKLSDRYGLTPADDLANCLAEHAPDCYAGYVRAEVTEEAYHLYCGTRKGIKCTAVCALKKFIGGDVPQVVINLHVEVALQASERAAKKYASEAVARVIPAVGEVLLTISAVETGLCTWRCTHSF